MDGDPADDVSAMLQAWGTGGAEEEERLAAVVQPELRRIAAAYLRRERRDHTLQPTALINEAYVRLLRGRGERWEHRAHFYGGAARVMRQILVDHARRRAAAKRAGRRVDRSLSRVPDPSHGRDVDVLALHHALSDLANLDPRQAQIVELRYFGGLTEEEVAAVVKVSPATVRRDVAAARFWLGRRMKGA